MSGHHAAPERSDPAAVRARLAALIRDVPDYPRPGVVFKDLTPLFADAEAFAAAVRELVLLAGSVTAAAAEDAGEASGAGEEEGGEVAAVATPAAVVGIEARGFVLAAPVALALGSGFVPVRKQGKLPGAVHGVDYELEYGTARVEVHRDAFPVGGRVVIVDDVLATGGTVAATAELVRAAGAEVVGVAVVLELGFLGGRAALDKLLPGIPVHSLLTV